MLHPRGIPDVPEETTEVAHAAFPKGNIYMQMRDEMGVFYTDEAFAELFSRRGQPAQSPWQLALVTVMQFAEGLTDQQAADAVRGRIDWKYALGLELTDAGFDASVLCEFRTRLMTHEAAGLLLDAMLARFREDGLLKARGKQRTDSTHVLAAVRDLNRLECVGETMRYALNELAGVAPDWLREHSPATWYERYGKRVEAYRLPKHKVKREALAVEIGTDGYQLLSWLYAGATPGQLRALPAVEVLRQVWVQQFYLEEGQVSLRGKSDLPPCAKLIQSPYDPEARCNTKRDLTWTGYAAHLTETCDEDTPHFITHVATTPATTADVMVTETIHAELAARDLLPSEHLLDTGYMSVSHLITARTDYEVELLGPVLPDNSWQAQAGKGFDSTAFDIDWDEQTVTCPQGQVNHTWSSSHDQTGQEVIHMRFARADCRVCSCRADCTHSQTAGRSLKLYPEPLHTALQAARQQQTTEDFKTQYRERAGIEGTISQETRAFGMRRSRYIGLKKTHLQHVITAAATNLVRWWAWATETPHAQTRQSRFARLAA